MTLTYSLCIEDHLAWYDTCARLFPPSGWKAIPLFGALFRSGDRERYRASMLSPTNHLAFGNRSTELSPKGIREFNEAFDFFVRWEEHTVVAATSDHLFLAQASLSSRIIPFRACKPPATRDALLAYVREYSKADPTIRNA